MKYLKYLGILISFSAFSQINTDRPTQSFSPFVLPKGTFQIESGFISEKPVSGGRFANITYLGSQFRYGLVERFELRLYGDFKGAEPSGITGMGPTILGAKFHLSDEKGSFPQIGFLANYVLTNGDKAFAVDDPVKDFRVLFQNALSEKFTLAYNIGMFWQGNEDATGLYTVMLGYSATDKLSLFVEPYGFFKKDEAKDSRVNGGLVYLVSDNFQLDASAGVGLSERAPDSFVALGVSIML